MRRVVEPIVRYVVDSVRHVAASWDAFWYTPADPTLLGLIRILTGLMLIYTHAVWGLALSEFYGPDSWLSPALMRALQNGQDAYSFWWLVPYQWMWPAYVASMVVLVLFTIGFWTRLTGLLSLIVAISFAYRAQEAMFGLDQINVMLTLYLTIGGAGQALSVDRRLAVRRLGLGPASVRPDPSAAANLGQRLINVHMCVIYFFAGVSKLQGPAWWNGEAMWGAFANLEYQSTDMTFLAWHPWLINLASHISILWEIFFCVLIWRPRWRPLMLAGAVVLHVGIGAFLGMWTFGLIMLVGCSSFLPNDLVRGWFDSLGSKPKPHLSANRPHESRIAELVEL